MATTMRTARDTGEGSPSIQTVQRAALILDSFTVSKPHLSLNEITARLGASKATAHRYTGPARGEPAALRRPHGAVLARPAGAHARRRGAAALPIVSAAEPYMDRLVQSAGQTVVLSIWDGESPTVVRSADNTDHLIRISVRVGSRLDLATSAQGRVFCAYLPPEQVPALAKLLRRSPGLREDVDWIREHGLSVNSPSENGLHTIAAPVFEGDSIIATMAIVGTSVDVPRRADSPMAEALLEITRELSQRLGTNGPGRRGGRLTCRTRPGRSRPGGARSGQLVQVGQGRGEVGARRDEDVDVDARLFQRLDVVLRALGTSRNVPAVISCGTPST